MNNDRVTLSIFEIISFPEFNLDSIKAKIDTGAYTGALHCTKITEDNKILKFSPFDHPETEISTDKFSRQTIKSSNASSELRYVISTTVNILGKNYPIDLSLANRSEMKVPVLIGRKFLKANNFLIDASVDNR